MNWGVEGALRTDTVSPSICVSTERQPQGLTIESHAEFAIDITSSNAHLRLALILIEVQVKMPNFEADWTWLQPGYGL